MIFIHLEEVIRDYDKYAIASLHSNEGLPKNGVFLRINLEFSRNPLRVPSTRLKKKKKREGVATRGVTRGFSRWVVYRLVVLSLPKPLYTLRLTHTFTH